jgi:hypothetical protein
LQGKLYETEKWRDPVVGSRHLCLIEGFCAFIAGSMDIGWLLDGCWLLVVGCWSWFGSRRLPYLQLLQPKPVVLGALKLGLPPLLPPAPLTLTAVNLVFKLGLLQLGQRC